MKIVKFLKNNFYLRKRIFLVIVALVVLILIVLSIFIYSKVTKQKLVYIYTNTKDSEIEYKIDNVNIPIEKNAIGNLVILHIPTDQGNGVITIDKDGYLEKVVNIDGSSPINFKDINLVKAEEIILPAIAPNSLIISNISPAPVILTNDPDKIYYLKDNTIMLLDNSAKEKDGILKEIYQMPIDNNSSLTYFDVSPDSNYLLLQTLDGAANVKTTIVNLTTKEQKDCDLNSEFVWSSDSQLYYLKSEENSSSLMKSDISFSNPVKILDLPANSYDLTISPDNKYASVIYKKDSNLWAYIISLDGSVIKEFDLAYNGDSLPFARWSANSQKITFFNNQDQIFIYDIISKKEQTEKLAVLAGIFSWNQDASNYYYLINNQKLDMPFVIKNKNNKQIAEFIEAPQSIMADKNGNLNIFFSGSIERINFK